MNRKDIVARILHVYIIKLKRQSTKKKRCVSIYRAPFVARERDSNPRTLVPGIDLYAPDATLSPKQNTRSSFLAQQERELREMQFIYFVSQRLIVLRTLKDSQKDSAKTRAGFGPQQMASAFLFFIFFCYKNFFFWNNFIALVLNFASVCLFSLSLRRRRCECARARNKIKNSFRPSCCCFAMQKPKLFIRAKWKWDYTVKFKILSFLFFVFFFASIVYIAICAQI